MRAAADENGKKSSGHQEQHKPRPAILKYRMVPPSASGKPRIIGLDASYRRNDSEYGDQSTQRHQAKIGVFGDALHQRHYETS